MKSLVFYSGGQNPGNSELHRVLVRLAQARRRPARSLTMTYVPFCTEGSRTFFYRAIRRYAPFGVIDFLCLDPEQNPSPLEIREALRSDIVYLAGGNTFFFLHQLRRLHMLGPLREFVARGGVLAGLRGLDPDPNDVGLRDHGALGLVPFEFAPHFSPVDRVIRALTRYSRGIRHPVYASRDGGGIVMEGRAISFIGPTWAFSRGSCVRLQ